MRCFLVCMLLLKIKDAATDYLRNFINNSSKNSKINEEEAGIEKVEDDGSVESNRMFALTEKIIQWIC